MELVESCWSKDQLLTMADLGNWTSEFLFVSVHTFYNYYLCFKMIFPMMIQLVTGQ